MIMGFLCCSLPTVCEYVGQRTSVGNWSPEIRLLALTMILCRAGLGLDVEASMVAVIPQIFLDLDWLWVFMLGHVVMPISPAVVIISVLAFQGQGYGAITGIPSMMVAAAALDDVLSFWRGSGFSAIWPWGSQATASKLTRSIPVATMSSRLRPRNVMSCSRKPFGTSRPTVSA